MIDIEKLRTMELHGDKLNKEQRDFVLKEFLKFYKLTSDSNFDSFKDWLSWDEDKRNKEYLPAIEVFKLVTEKGVPKERVELLLESEEIVTSWIGYEVHMDEHRRLSGSKKPKTVF